jgi:hypothetical protein
MLTITSSEVNPRSGIDESQYRLDIGLAAESSAIAKSAASGVGAR